MRNRVIQKFVLMTATYLVLIFGIFILQFKRQSAISVSLGSLKLSFVQAADPSSSQAASLLNKFSASFNGISLSSSDENCASFKGEDGSELNLTLFSWEQTSPSSARLVFSGNENAVQVPLDFSVREGGEPGEQSLSMEAQIPEGVSEISIPFKTAGSHTVTESAENRLLLDSKDAAFEFFAPRIDERRIRLYRGNSVASYAAYHPSTKFTFDQAAAGYASAKAAYDAAREDFCGRLLSSFSETEAAQLTEKFVMAYVAEMARTGRYPQALESVPVAFKRGSKRTFLSSPYFDNLSAMNASFDQYADKVSAMIDRANSSGSMELFESPDALGYISVRGSRTNVLAFASKMKSLGEEISPGLNQAAGILELYAALARNGDSLAQSFEAAARKSLRIIEDSLVREEGGSLLSVESANPLQPVQIAALGSALLHYGEQAGDSGVAAAGMSVAGSQLPQISDAASVGEAYPLVMQENLFYPRLQRVNSTGTVWCWSAANSISFTRDANNSDVLKIEFPVNWSHYMIIRGIDPFSSIRIYNVQYRSASDFESYNSSGYIYRENSRTLLLKSRHKEKFEQIVMGHEKPSEQKPKPQPSQPRQPAPAKKNEEDGGMGWFF